MTDCHIISDRMPAVAHGRSAWRPSEAAHLESCAGCALEWTLVRAALDVGGHAAERVDGRRVAAQVRERLAAPARIERPEPRRAWWVAGLAAAAVVALVIYSVQSKTVPPAADGSAPVLSVLHELDDLTSSELEAVLEYLPTAASDSNPHSDSGGLGDLNPAELERVLHSLEG